MKRLLQALALPALLLAALAILQDPIDRQDGDAPAPLGPELTSEIERGRELVVLADCKACHTARGGHAFAGNRAIPTAFGTFFSPNITPDPDTGIGRWTEDDFWRALHEGRAPDGKLLYPVFPYPNYTKISRRDARAMFAYLRSLPPVRLATSAHEIDFPYNQRFLIAAWRRLYFKPGVYVADSSASAAWNRGAYLVEGVAHCGACHEARDRLGGTPAQVGPAGGVVLSWYAPALNDDREAGLSNWSEDEIVALLKDGRTPSHDNLPPRASTLGPMAEVVFESLRHTAPDELQAMAIYLKSLPEARRASVAARGRNQERHVASVQPGGAGPEVFAATAQVAAPDAAAVASSTTAITSSTAAVASSSTAVASSATPLAPNAATLAPDAAAVPSNSNPHPRRFGSAATAWLASGAELYQEHCASCHGKNGEGSPAAIALAGNRAVTMRSTVNPIRAVLYGGYPPGSAANPRPYGMPPFSHTLQDHEIAQVVSFLRTAWGNDAPLVAANEVAVQRTGPLW